MSLLLIRVCQDGRLFKTCTNPSGGKSLESRSQCRRRATGKRRMPWANCWIGTSSSLLSTMIEHYTRSVKRQSSRRDLMTFTYWDSLGHRFQDPRIFVSEISPIISHESIQEYQSTQTRLGSWPRRLDHASVFTEKQSFLNLLLPLALLIGRQCRGNDCMIIPPTTLSS